MKNLMLLLVPLAIFLGGGVLVARCAGEAPCLRTVGPLHDPESRRLAGDVARPHALARALRLPHHGPPPCG